MHNELSLLPTEERRKQLQCLAISLACATSVVTMHTTGTTHPPTGATALLTAVNTYIRAPGWYYLPVAPFSSALVLAVAVLTNNFRCRYQVFCFTPPYCTHTTAAAYMRLPFFNSPT